MPSTARQSQRLRSNPMSRSMRVSSRWRKDGSILVSRIETRWRSFAGARGMGRISNRRMIPAKGMGKTNGFIGARSGWDGGRMRGHANSKIHETPPLAVADESGSVLRGFSNSRSLAKPLPLEGRFSASMRRCCRTETHDAVPQPAACLRQELGQTPVKRQPDRQCLALRLQPCGTAGEPRRFGLGGMTWTGSWEAC